MDKFEYTTKKKGLPVFSGRSQAKMHANLAPSMKQAATGTKGIAKQNKQKGKK